MKCVAFIATGAICLPKGKHQDKVENIKSKMTIGLKTTNHFGSPTLLFRISKIKITETDKINTLNAQTNT